MDVRQAILRTRALFLLVREVERGHRCRRQHRPVHWFCSRFLLLRRTGNLRDIGLHHPNFDARGTISQFENPRGTRRLPECGFSHQLAETFDGIH